MFAEDVLTITDDVLVDIEYEPSLPSISFIEFSISFQKSTSESNFNSAPESLELLPELLLLSELIEFFDVYLPPGNILILKRLVSSFEKTILPDSYVQYRL